MKPGVRAGGRCLPDPQGGPEPLSPPPAGGAWPVGAQLPPPLRPQALLSHFSPRYGLTCARKDLAWAVTVLISSAACPAPSRPPGPPLGAATGSWRAGQVGRLSPVQGAGGGVFGAQGGAGWCGERGGHPAALWVLWSPRHGCSLEKRHHPTWIPQAPRDPQAGPTTTSRPGRYIPGRPPHPTPRQEWADYTCQPGRCAGDSGQTSPAPGLSFPSVGLSSHPAHCHLRMSNTVARGQGQGRSPPLAVPRLVCGTRLPRSCWRWNIPESQGPAASPPPAVSAAPALALLGGRVLVLGEGRWGSTSMPQARLPGASGGLWGAGWLPVPWLPWRSLIL